MTVTTSVKTVLETLPCTLPTEKIPDDVDPAAIATTFAQRINDLSLEDFTSDALWRDTFALTGSLRTFYSAVSIIPVWRKLCHSRGATAFALLPGTAHVRRTGPEVCWLDVSFTFETENEPATSCYGFLSLVPDPDQSGNWKIWLLRTVLEQLQGNHGNVDQLAPVMSDSAKLNGFPKAVDGEQHFDCVVVGAGQAGLSTAGRLQALGVSYVLIERNDQVGDNWLLRYDSVKLHTTREYAHLPFDRTFTPDYPEWLTKHDLARGYKKWVAKYGINVWLSTNLESGVWDESRKQWILNLRKRHANGDCLQSISCSHVVMAVGGGCQVPIMPSYPGREKFKGVVLHSADYKNPFSWRGKHGVVIGTANTGHDVADDMVEAGLESVTMVQRGRTYVVPQEAYKKGADALYNAKIPSDVADRIAYSSPLVVSRQIGLLHSRYLAAAEPERFDALERVGFRVDRYGEVVYQLHEKFGGHYMDVGTSRKIADGLIKIKSDALPVAYTEDGLEFSDGSHLKADVIVFATGFAGNMRDVVREIFGSEVADVVEDFWGLNSEGELRGAFKPSGHPRLWYMGGTVGHARYFSRFVALQIKAAVLGTPLPIFESRGSQSIL
ncbi:Flavin-containing monooxygenase [Rasamsonia emersonii CBS 393.64]|uniref:Flavin-containing monooxygenase n=1 Tax=Rasamsonia emersonii (strain ATCC 16479 / CBS 393.64 / IMI 116815) TaxID=1408163 RepID=A0A0F4YTH9_RASE3|nr:Flavin-containing monooxygenase [Rasamsonia emersonii CBS 393.64]KKA21554.1 Flavin-containing monooxygenase [Rasamsonia emersonii CBS 393.64]